MESETFEKCTFEGVDWTLKQFQNCTFTQCYLSVIKLENTKFIDTVFKDCKIVGLDFFKCDPLFFTPSFTSCLLQTCNFSDLKMPKISFRGSKILEGYFQNNLLSQADFRDTDLLGSIFHHCNLNGADFRDAKNYIIDLHSCTLKKAKMSFPEVLELLRGYEIEILM